MVSKIYFIVALSLVATPLAGETERVNHYAMQIFLVAPVGPVSVIH